MTQEEKLLLYKELCAMMPYGVVCLHPYGFGKLDSISAEDYGIEVTFKTNDDNYYMIEQCTPCLRPMSSMSESEKDELIKLCTHSYTEEDWEGDIDEVYGIQLFWKYNKNSNESAARWEPSSFEALEWLYMHHFDIHGLIEKKLAIAAPENIYK